MTAHAKLPASASHRWLACPRSVKLCEGMPDKTSIHADLGTAAHSCCEDKLLKALGRDSDVNISNLPYYDAEMEANSNAYRDYVMTVVAEVKATCKDPLVLVEQKLSLDNYIPEGFGTADALVCGNDVLHIIDYKNGQGVQVSAEENTQLMCYALGALDMFDCLYEGIKKVELHIFQPRRDNYSNWCISVKELRKWGEEVLRPIAKLAAAGEGEFQAGEHCRFCKAKAVCRARAEYNLVLCKLDFAQPDILTDTEVSVVLEKASQLASWVEDVQQYALGAALSGKEWPGYKVVEGRSTRKYVDEEAVAKAVDDYGKDPYEKKLLGVTAMTNLLGKKKFEELLGSLIVKPQGKPTLVPVSDKRPALNNAKNDFMEVF